MSEKPSLSKSALILSPCLAWTHPSARYYDDRFTDKSARDSGTRVHKAIDLWLRKRSEKALSEKTQRPS